MLNFYLKQELKSEAKRILPFLSAAILNISLFFCISGLKDFWIQGLILSLLFLLIGVILSVVLPAKCFSKCMEEIQKSNKKDLSEHKQRYASAALANSIWSIVSSIAFLMIYQLRIHPQIAGNNTSGTALGVILMLFLMTFIFEIQLFIQLYLCTNAAIKFKKNSKRKTFLILYAVFLILVVAVLSVLSFGTFSGLEDLPDILSLIGSFAFYLFWTNLICSAVCFFLGFWLYRNYIMQKRYLHKSR